MVLEVKIRASSKKISKIEAARRQLDAAIELLFENRDIVTVHTVASAACQVLQDLCQNEKLPLAFDKMFAPSLERGMEIREVREAYREHRNFFKHAQNKKGMPETRDHEIDEFNPFLNVILIRQGTEDYESLTKNSSTHMSAFFMWLCLCYPEMLSGDAKDKKLIQKHLKKYHDKIMKGLSYNDKNTLGLIMLYLQTDKPSEALKLANQIWGNGKELVGLISNFYKGHNHRRNNFLIWFAVIVFILLFYM
jgi:hypothetical protein